MCTGKIWDEGWMSGAKKANIRKNKVKSNSKKEWIYFNVSQQIIITAVKTHLLNYVFVTGTCYVFCLTK